MNPTTNLRKIENAYFIHESQLESNPFQPREYFDEDRLGELREDIRANGVKQPILVRPHSDAAKAARGIFQICSGERRVRASRGAGPDRQEIPAIVEELSDLEMRERALQENIQRETLTDFEEAKALKGLWDLYEQQGVTMSIREMARRMNVAPGYVTKRLDALGFKPDVVELLSTHRNVLSSATLINEVENGGAREELIKRVEEGAGFREIKKTVEAIREEEKQAEAVNHAPDVQTEQRQKLHGRNEGGAGAMSRGRVVTGGPTAREARIEVSRAILNIEKWEESLTADDHKDLLLTFAQRIQKKYE